MKLELNQEDGFARFTVTDTGQGIPPEFLPGVFDMFSQAPTSAPPLTKAFDGGLGVGLALVQQLTLAQGGRVQAESAGVNQGSVFNVWLPLVSANAESTAAETSHRASIQGLRILAVDDMAEVVEPFAELLGLAGAKVDVATSGAAALDKLKSGGYDLLISDIGMEAMDGFELIRRVRQRPELLRLQAIALSGYGRQVDVDRALQSGFNAHVSKPASVEDILQAVAGLTFPDRPDQPASP
jgi:two-component system CheB/CheR fusion protein